MEKFCYKCGALKDEKGPLIEGVCKECFSEENPLLKAPDEVELTVCKQCGAYFIENEIQDVKMAPLEEYIEASKELVSSKIEVLQLGPTGVQYVDFEDSEGVNIDFRADYTAPEVISVDLGVQVWVSDSQDEAFTDRKTVRVELSKTTCEVCRKRETGYYEAVLQVRGESDLSEDKISEVFQALREEFLKHQKRSRDEFVSKVQKKHGGINLYTSSTKLAKNLARFLKKEYGADMNQSSELIGQTDDGKERRRVTIVARLPM